MTGAGIPRPSGTSGLRRWIVAIGAVSLCAIVVSSAYDVWRGYQRVVADAHREITNAGKALAELISGEQPAMNFRFLGDDSSARRASTAPLAA